MKENKKPNFIETDLECFGNFDLKDNICIIAVKCAISKKKYMKSEILDNLIMAIDDNFMEA